MRQVHRLRVRHARRASPGPSASRPALLLQQPSGQPCRTEPVELAPTVDRALSSLGSFVFAPEEPPSRPFWVVLGGFSGAKARGLARVGREARSAAGWEPRGAAPRHASAMCGRASRTGRTTTCANPSRTASAWRGDPRHTCSARARELRASPGRHAGRTRSTSTSRICDTLLGYTCRTSWKLKGHGIDHVTRIIPQGVYFCQGPPRLRGTGSQGSHRRLSPLLGPR